MRLPDVLENGAGPGEPQPVDLRLVVTGDQQFVSVPESSGEAVTSQLADECPGIGPATQFLPVVVELNKKRFGVLFF